MELPGYAYGQVVGRIITAVGDQALNNDLDLYPDAVGAKGKVRFHPKEPYRIVVDSTIAPSSFVKNETVVAVLDTDGDLTVNGVKGVFLWTGAWTVVFDVGFEIDSFDILVESTHTPAAPLDLFIAQSQSA
jgi:hypothetical protein